MATPDPARFLNRESSWLEFDARVLALAVDPGLPLLERVRFLAIASRNLDEFFQVRVAGLLDQEAAGLGAVSSDGRTPTEQLASIRERALALVGDAEAIFAKELRPALAEAGLAVTDWSDLDESARAHLGEVFDQQIFPVLTPLAVDPTHPFPYVSNLSLNLAVLTRRGDAPTAFARIKVPPLLPRLLPAGDGRRWVPVEQVIGAHLGPLFPDVEIEAWGCFRVTRDADLELRESKGLDLIRSVETSLHRRRRSSDAVRLEVESGLPAHQVELLARRLGLADRDVYLLAGPLDLGAMTALAALDRPDLALADWPTTCPAALAHADPDGPRDLFGALREGDVLVHHPYESFEDTVEAFLEQASVDPDVLAIKLTLYRTGGPESDILKALQRAAAGGKQVVVVVELKARFDEEANVERARALEESGAHVVYGLVGLKTHAKAALVVRQEADGLRRYAHLGTGNYNPRTARGYEDLGLLTADPDLTADVADLFNALTSGSQRRSYRRLLVAPAGLRPGLEGEIRREIDAGPDGHVVAKLNALADPDMIDLLYEASRAGVRIDLATRAICCLRPGVPGLSETVRVRSILGRYLEHSRLYRFGGPARGFRYWMGSADLMLRNLDLRVEVLAPLADAALQARAEEILAAVFGSETAAWELRSDGSWHRNGGSVDVQERMQAAALARNARPGSPSGSEET